MVWLLAGNVSTARGEAMLQLFNVNWDELVQKMPEIAEAGYTSLWLPPPAKAGSVYSVGYDLFDPFDLGDKDQRGTVRTRYGTKSELQRVVEMAHRFGIRVYFDNIMNHRGFDIPGYNASTPTNLYPGMVPADFHLKTVGTNFQNWPSVANWNNVWEVQNQPLFGLVDIATENGSVNSNFGNSLGNTITKPVLVRHPGTFSYYMDTNLPAIAGPWRPFNGTNGDPVPEDVNAYLIRAALWTMAETRCDGFRFDAVKHVNSSFFGDLNSATVNGYGGAIQAMFDYVHGYGSNVTSNGYVETDDNRNSLWDTETTRNDAMLFGEHLGEPPSFQEYLDRGMRLLNSPYHYQFNNIFGVSSIAGLQNRDYTLGYGFPGQVSVLFAQSHDDGTANRRELHNAYNFFREGLPSIYSDGYNQSSAPDYFPRVASAPYLGQFGDVKMPEVAYLHHQLARGGTRPRWGDNDLIAFERYDYRDPGSAADQTVVLFAMNDNYSAQGDAAFVDGEGEAFPSGVNKPPGTLGDAQGLVVNFPPGSVLSQLVTGTAGYDRTYKRVTVRPATNTRSVATASGGAIVYVGSQVIPAGGGAIEILIPSGGYVAYGYQWPEASRAALKDAITLRQAGADAPRITVLRRDGVNGDTSFNPITAYKMRGSINPDGSIAGGVNFSNRTYAIDVPIITNGVFDVQIRSDASTVNTLLKLDGGVDVNSQMGLGSTNADKRDNLPGVATDLYLGYEQTAFVNRKGPEKFAARLINRNNVTSAGAETYYYTVGSTNLVTINGSSNGFAINTATANWVYHDPAAPCTATNNSSLTQRLPLAPTNGQPVDLWVKVGYQFQINKCFIYYTTNGSNPEGSFGVGTGSTKVVEAFWVAADTADSTIDWWKGTIPGVNQVNGQQIRYKIALHRDGISEISDADDSKRFGLNLAAITNFNPATALVWLHANRKTNDTVVGLQEGFHILRARTFLPRTNKSAVFNTFAQTFYYDGALPTGAVAFPATDGSTLNGNTYTVVVRADSTVTGVEFNIQDSLAANDDVSTGRANGNGSTNGQPIFVAATSVSPDGGIGAQYPQLPQEYRFVYTNIPTSGSATITVRLKEFSTSVYSNRFTTLTRTVNTLAPLQYIEFSRPSTNGTVLNYATNQTFVLQACFSPSLALAATNFNLLINGVLQPSASYIVRGVGVLGTNVCPGLRSFTFNWNNPPIGSNLVQLIYTNLLVPVSDTRVITVAPPLRITGLENNNQQVVWDSAPGLAYRVLATTNLLEPFQDISGVISGSGTTMFFYDPNPAVQKFYQVQQLP